MFKESTSNLLFNQNFTFGAPQSGEIFDGRFAFEAAGIGLPKIGCSIDVRVYLSSNWLDKLGTVRKSVSNKFFCRIASNNRSIRMKFAFRKKEF